jgi:hypothetical protein
MTSLCVPALELLMAIVAYQPPEAVPNFRGGRHGP